MQAIIMNKEFGTIEYTEGFWTGKKTLVLNGLPLKKFTNNIFLLPDGRHAAIKGNYIIGAQLLIGERNITLTSSITWYEIILAFLPFAFDIIWGNSPTLYKIIPIVGGGIGGFISALIGFLAANAMKESEKTIHKVLKGLGFFLLSIIVLLMTSLVITAAACGLMACSCA